MSTQTTTAVKINGVNITIKYDSDPDLSYLDQFKNAEKGSEERKYYKQDQKRKSNYGDTWYMVGIYAKASLVINGVTQELRSGGLWNIESDSDRSHFISSGKDEIAELKEIVTALGIDSARFDKLAFEALANIETP